MERPLNSWMLGLVLALAVVAAHAAPDPEETRRLHELFDRRWEETARYAPEWATFRGDHRYDDRLSDASPAGIAAQDAALKRTLAEARAIRRDRLAPVDQVSLDLFIDGAERFQKISSFDGYRRQSISSSFGFQTRFAGLLRAMPAETPQRAEQVLARMAAYPKRVEQEIERVRGAIALGWVAPRPVLERALQQLDGQLAPAPRDGPFFEPFRRMGADMAPAEQEAWRQRGEQAIVEQVLPAQRQLRAFIVEELLSVAPSSGGLLRYPGGVEVYAELVRQNTTTDLTPQRVHELGLREMARLRAEFDTVRKAMKFDGSFAEFVGHLNGPQYRYASSEAMLEGYRSVAKRIDPEMPALFAELPRIPYGIRPMPSFLGAGAADNYTAPPADGSGPGWYNANILAYQRRPRWALPTLVAHEAVPGHHLQSARAREIGRLPEFRQQGFYTAYSEGWALYAETLGERFGLYAAPEDRFGHLQAQAMRAARLVVDSGLHALGWTREQAIDYMVRETGESPLFVESEVDRYLSNPGQALAYMVGKLKIVELRDRAQAKLGARFDLRRFHNLVLDQGPLPLTVLERYVEEWIATQAAAAPG
jgi:uncharacterized protein (DUF885 family)